MNTILGTLQSRFILAFTAVFFAGSLVVYAQSGHTPTAATTGSVLKAALKGGATLTKVHRGGKNLGYKWGYQAGACFAVDFIRVLGIQAELLYSQTALEYGTFFGGSKNKTTLTSLEIPLLLRLNAGDYVTFNLGPQFGKNVSHSLYQRKADGGFFNKLGSRMSYLGGLEVSFPKPQVRLYARYHWDPSSFANLALVGKTKVNQFQLGVILPPL